MVRNQQNAFKSMNALNAMAHTDRF